MPVKSWLLAFASCFFIFFPYAGQCHTRLVSSEPASKQVLTQAPTQVRLNFSAPVEKKFSYMELAKLGRATGQQSDWTALQATVTNQEMTATLPVLAPAKYRVRWRVLSSDGHLQHGQFDFELQ